MLSSRAKLAQNERRNARAPRCLWNYKAPIPYQGQHLFIQPNFSSSRKPDLALAIARNSEVPSQLKEAGHLTDAEHAELFYTQCPSDGERKIFVGFKPEEAIFNAMHWGEKAIQDKLPLTWLDMKELREIICEKQKAGRDDSSKWEALLSGCSKKSSERTTKIGFTVDPSGTRLGVAQVNKKIVDEPENVAKVSRLAARIVCALLENSAPKGVLDCLRKQADIDVPLTIGSADNKWFTTTQFNMSSVGEVSLELSIGQVGGLHLDYLDDPTRYTVLLCLSNIPDGYWPGRTVITSLRLYAVMAPMTALIFKGVHPHISFGPKKMERSTRKPYIPTTIVPKLDQTKYIFARVMCVNYPKDRIFQDSTTRLRKEYCQITNPSDFPTPTLLPFAIAAFGTVENQLQWHACADAKRAVELAKINPGYHVPLASKFADMYVLNGIRTPDYVIQRVLDANRNERDIAEVEDFRELCRNLLSHEKWNSNCKKGDMLETRQVGSTFDPQNLPKLIPYTESTMRKDQLAEVFGDKPFQCPLCMSRSKSEKGMKTHFGKAHSLIQNPGKFEPSRTPGFIPRPAADGNGEKRDVQKRVVRGVKNQRVPSLARTANSGQKRKHVDRNATTPLNGIFPQTKRVRQSGVGEDN